jgi:hypothetical protein
MYIAVLHYEIQNMMANGISASGGRTYISACASANEAVEYLSWYPGVNAADVRVFEVIEPSQYTVRQLKLGGFHIMTKRIPASGLQLISRELSNDQRAPDQVHDGEAYGEGQGEASKSASEGRRKCDWGVWQQPRLTICMFAIPCEKWNQLVQRQQQWDKEDSCSMVHQVHGHHIRLDVTAARNRADLLIVLSNMSFL